jgi:hypothetical protein
MEIGTIIFIAIILAIFFGPNLITYLKKKKFESAGIPAPQHASPSQGTTQSPQPIDWGRFDKSDKIQPKDQTPSIKSAINKLTDAIQENKENMENILHEVTGLRKDVYDKAMSLKDMDEELTTKEELLVGYLDAIRRAMPQNDPLCKNCQALMRPIEGQENAYVCPKCGGVCK